MNNSAVDAPEAPAVTARRLMRTAWKACLGTIDATSGHPYVSLVAVACEASGTPLLLLSGLALHTKNLIADPRATLLFDGTEAGVAALTGARVTLAGRLAEVPEADGLALARDRYLARHPSAAMYADFADFHFYRLGVEWAHQVAGFGRIQRLQPADLILDVGDSAELIAAERDIVQHMNEDHAAAIQHMAAARGGAAAAVSSEPWRMIGCDPEGIDLVRGDDVERVVFPQRIKSANEARVGLIALVNDARAKLGHQS